MSLAEAEYSMTDIAMGNAASGLGPQKGDEGLAVRFFMMPVQDMVKTVEEARPIFEEKEMVEICAPGSKDVLCVRAIPKYKTRFPEHYKLFRDRVDGEDGIVGTPLSQVPWITRSQVEELKFFKVFTVEHLAGMSDTNAQNFMAIGKLRDLAKAYAQDAKDAAPMTKMLSELESRDNEIEAMKAQIAELVEGSKKSTSKKKAAPKADDTQGDGGY